MGRNFFQRELQALPLCFVKSLKCNEVSPSIETKSSQPVQSGMLMLDKTQEGSLKVNQFDLQPLVSNFSSEPKVVDERVQLVPGWILFFSMKDFYIPKNKHVERLPL